jgi:hypothetical protein
LNKQRLVAGIFVYVSESRGFACKAGLPLTGSCPDPTWYSYQEMTNPTRRSVPLRRRTPKRPPASAMFPTQNEAIVRVPNVHQTRMLLSCIPTEGSNAILGRFPAPTSREAGTWDVDRQAQQQGLERWCIGLERVAVRQRRHRQPCLYEQALIGSDIARLSSDQRGCRNAMQTSQVHRCPVRRHPPPSSTLSNSSIPS